jgi:hypothetical protein
MDRLKWPEPRPTCHGLRHTWKTNALNSGVDVEVKETILGHATHAKDVTSRYGFISDKTLFSAVDSMSSDHGPTVVLANIRKRKASLPGSVLKSDDYVF